MSSGYYKTKWHERLKYSWLSLPIAAKLFICIFAISVIIAIIYLISINPCCHRIKNTQELFSYRDYKISEYVASRYITYKAMRDFNFAFHYGFGFLPVAATIIAVAYAMPVVTVPNDAQKAKITPMMKKSATARHLLRFPCLLFTVLNYMINPKWIALTAQNAWIQLEQVITTVLYDVNIESIEKNAIIARALTEIEATMSKMYS